MAARPGPLWLLGLALCALSGGGPGPRPPPGCPQRRLGPRERRDLQHEILAVLGLPGRPRPRAPPAGARLPLSAPLFMLDLYHAMAGDDDEDGGSRERLLGRADLVMSFVNMGERGLRGWASVTLPCPCEDGHPRGGTRALHLSYWPHLPLEKPGLVPAQYLIISGTQRLWASLRLLAYGSRFCVLLKSSPKPGRGPCCVRVPGHCPRVTALSLLSVSGHSVDPGLAGLLGQRAPRSKQPFMVTFFRASSSPIRAPRAVRPLKRRLPKKTNELPQPNKLPGIFDDVHGSHGRHVCRRHELYVSFQDLGWLDWVIAPQGYSAYYCEGECSFPLDSCMNATNHAILQSLVHLMKPDAVPKACCAPTKLSATSVLYYDSSNNVILRKHRNMVVKACGCH
ncbi:bone morphogenetic protein 8B [Pteropus medius]|uniref:bone morphogenetic protein 8B n=1 Tax=Pteropus vampyrus TaxID=132908 RepID=UPI00196AFB7D|nr:bone morphogenetic protein 8B [Pteropus giganteus]